MDSPQVNYLRLAKITRKVLDRLAPFCYMQDAASGEKATPDSSSIATTKILPPQATLPSSALSSPEISPSPSLSGSPLSQPAHLSSPSSSGAVQLSARAQSKLVGRIKSRVANVVRTIDSHIHAAQVAFKMCREGMVLCDDDVRGSGGAGAGSGGKVKALSLASGEDGDGSELPEREAKEAEKDAVKATEKAKGDEGWDVDIDPDEADDRGVPAPVDEKHQYGTSGHHFLLHFAHQGLELVRKTEDSFNEVRQEAYKIAAQTKDRNIIVFVPAGPGQPVRKQLKDLGLDLVASLSLLESDFGRQVKETVAWWNWVIEDLEKGEKSSLCPIAVAPAPETEHAPPQATKHTMFKGIKSRRTSTSSSSSGSSSEGGSYDREKMGKAYGWWEEAKEGWQAYYDIIATLHIVYHDLLISSADAWDGTTVVLKPRENDNDSGSDIGRQQTRTASGNSASARGGGANDEREKEYEMVRQEVPHTLDGNEAKDQDRAVKKRGKGRGTGFLTWKAPYAEAPSSTEKGTLKAGKGEKGEKQRKKGLWRTLTCR